MAQTKNNRRKKIHRKIRRKIFGTPQKPRLSVFRSNKGMYCQLVDDLSGNTLISASTSEIEGSGTKTEQATELGKILANKCLENNIKEARFDRSGYLYHGRIKALAEGAREGGLNI